MQPFISNSHSVSIHLFMMFFWFFLIFFEIRQRTIVAILSVRWNNFGFFNISNIDLYSMIIMRERKQYEKFFSLPYSKFSLIPIFMAFCIVCVCWMEIAHNGWNWNNAGRRSNDFDWNVNHCDFHQWNSKRWIT